MSLNCCRVRVSTIFSQGGRESGREGVREGVSQSVTCKLIGLRPRGSETKNPERQGEGGGLEIENFNTKRV